MIYQKTIFNLDLPFQFTLLLFRCFYVNFLFVAKEEERKKKGKNFLTEFANAEKQCKNGSHCSHNFSITT